MFEISIVCHVLCSWFWRTVGVSPVLGVVLVVRLVFLVLGFGVVCLSCSSWFFCAVVRGCGGRVAGGSGSGGRCGAPGLHRLSSVGGGLGVLGPVVVKWFRGGRVAPGSSSALLGGGGLGVFFPLGALCSSGSGVGLRGLVGVGGFGGCRVGLGFFLRLLLFGPGRCRFLLGCGGWCWLWVVLVLFGEFDPGSGRTLAACLTHASRTGPLLFLGAG